jgi:hypothetical protein
VKAFASLGRGWDTRPFVIMGAASLLSQLLWPAIAPAQPKASPSPAEPPQQATVGQPTAAELESWQKAILANPAPKSGCFTATYPEKQWREVTCGPPPHKLYPSKDRPG